MLVKLLHPSSITCVCLMGSAWVCASESFAFALSSCLSAAALIDVTGRGRERGNLPLSASDGSIERKQRNARPPQMRPAFLPIQSSRRNRKSTLRLRAGACLDAGSHLLQKLSTCQVSGWVTKCLKKHHFECYQSNLVCFHHSLAKCDVFFLLLPERTYLLLSLFSTLFSLCISFHLSALPSVNPSIYPTISVISLVT